MAGLSSEGVKFGYKTSTGSSFTDVPNLLTTPEIGGGFNKIDVTTLADTQEKFIPGIKTLGDMDFEFLYDKTNFSDLKELETSKSIVEFQVSFPDQSTFTFSGYISVKMAETEVDSALKYVATVITNTDIEYSGGAA